MSLASRRSIIPPGPEARDGPRLADAHDGFVVSPVHILQSGLHVLAEEGGEPQIEKYPGWFRLGFPLLASSMLWAAILWSVGLFG